MKLPYIKIHKAAVLCGVDLVGVNIVFDIDDLPNTGNNDKDTIDAFTAVCAQVGRISVIDCARATTTMLADVVTQAAVSKAAGTPFVNPHPTKDQARAVPPEGFTAGTFDGAVWTRIDVSEQVKEKAVRDHLVAMGWTPPNWDGAQITL